MTSQSFTEQQIEDLIQALNASIHRLNGKINNDARAERTDLERVQFRKEKIERAKALIYKLNG